MRALGGVERVPRARGLGQRARSSYSVAGQLAVTAHRLERLRVAAVVAGELREERV